MARAHPISHTAMITRTALFLTLLCSVPMVRSQPTMRPPPPPPAVQAATTAPVTTTLERLAATAGVKTCMGAVKSIGPSLTGPETGYAAILMVNTKAVDSSMFSVSIERDEAEVARFVTASFSPTQSGGCDVSYEMVDTWKKSCQDVALLDLKYMQPLNVIGKSIQAVPYSASRHLYLMRVPGGCITISKEMLFQY